MFTGALAASYYGTPRTTTDVDIVVSVSREDLHAKLVQALRKAKLQVDGERIESAFDSEYRIVSLRDSMSPFTVDIILSSEKLEKKPGSLLALPTFYQTPEGLILAKLRMMKATLPRERSLKDKDDIRAILKFVKVDVNTIQRQALENNTLPLLRAIIEESSEQERS